MISLHFEAILFKLMAWFTHDQLFLQVIILTLLIKTTGLINDLVVYPYSFVTNQKPHIQQNDNLIISRIQLKILSAVTLDKIPRINLSDTQKSLNRTFPYHKTNISCH